MNINHYCIIMAGGIGSRFWPLSRSAKPKQFIDALGIGKTFIQLTYERFASFIPRENFLVVTGEAYKLLVQEQLPMLEEEQILTEPCRRNTAPCVAYAMYKLKTKNPKAVAVVTPSDQYIANQAEFELVMQDSLAYVAKNDVLLTVGITPTFPATGYGYIQAQPNQAYSITKVILFKEKPDRKTAMLYLENGSYYWNSGMFIWSVDTITKALETYLPDVASLFASITPVYGQSDERRVVNETYEKSPSISVDYGIMEKADNVFVRCSASLGWSDVGTWGALYELQQKDINGNVENGSLVLYNNSRNTLVKELKPGKLVVVDNLDNYIVVDTEDVLMICRKDEDGVKSLIENSIRQSREFC